jgi:phosphoadenosine phosphosulfate reductase
MKYESALADVLNQRYADASTTALMEAVLKTELPGQVSVVSSFGTESAVLLHHVAQVDPATPVIFIDTLRLFPETLSYRDQLIDRLKLTGVRSLQPDPAALESIDPSNLRWSYDPDGCCAVRKVAPLKKALESVDAWISGRKAFQSTTRAKLPLFEVEEDRLKINPLAGWSREALSAYMDAHNLPRHALEAQGFLSIGCMPCTTPVKPGEDPRAGRWRGWDKVECGIHTPLPVDPATEPVF